MSCNSYNPSIPFVGPIPRPVAPGFTISIKGCSHPSCNRFAINLQCGPNVSPRDDVLLHIGVDFMRGCVLRNSIHNMSWGPEETEGYFPFTRGAPFEIVIRCEPINFNIAVNGQHLASFEHRIVYHRASHIAIDGEVNINSIEYNGTSNQFGSQVPSGLYPPLSNAPGFNHSTVPPYPVSPTIPLRSHSPQPLRSHSPQPPYPTSAPYGYQPSTSPGGIPGANYGAHAYPTQSPYVSGQGQHKQGVVDGLLKKIGVGGAASTGALAATAGLGYLGSKKAWKAQKKSRKKALKYGIPLAGAGLGAYAISKAVRGWSSSSSSSSSDEE